MSHHDFVSYNVLSPFLGNSGWFLHCKPEDCDPETRYERIVAKLQEQMNRRAIIALQEVCMEWSGRFHALFLSNGYYYCDSLYGSQWSGFMGVSLAFPMEKYELVNADIFRVGQSPAIKMLKDTDKKKTKGNPLCSSVRRFLSIGETITRIVLPVTVAASLILEVERVRDFYRFITLFLCVLAAVPGLQEFFVWSKPKAVEKLCSFEYSRKRYNNMISFELRGKDSSSGSSWYSGRMTRSRSKVSSGPSFIVSTYHMPCCYWQQPIMTIHTQLCAQRVIDLATADSDIIKPYVLLGDFNIKPVDGPYALITSGSISPDDPAYISEDVIAKARVSWKPSLEFPFRSAYMEYQGHEPSWTNHTVSGGEKKPNAFTDTIDYIFISDHWSVEEVLETPQATEAYPDHSQPLCPNEENPSDHILIGCTLDLSE